MNRSSLPQPLWVQDVVIEGGPAAADWIWHGIIARGNLTLLTSLWKSGKTTLVSLLLSRRKRGGTLCGLPVVPGKTVVVTEEDTSLWADRIRRGDMGNNVCFFPRPFRHIPTAEEWQALIDRILQVHRDHGIDLVVIDPLAPFVRDENHARGIFEALLPLSALTERGIAVLVLQHPRKGKVRAGQAARGSGALLGHVDISIEMRHPGGDVLTRRRRFLGYSRHLQTPRHLLLELNADGTDYVPVPDGDSDGFQSGWEQIRKVLETAPHKLTRHDILAQWPPDFNKPDPATLPPSGPEGRTSDGKTVSVGSKSCAKRAWESPIFFLVSATSGR